MEYNFNRFGWSQFFDDIKGRVIPFIYASVMIILFGLLFIYNRPQHTDKFYILIILLAVIAVVLVLSVVIRLFNAKQIRNWRDSRKNKTDFLTKYKTDSRAVVISCYFNPQKNPYRTKAFNLFYDKIKHLDHRIIECVIGDAQPELPENAHIKRIYTKNLLWHKEALLNKIVSELPEKYEYVFWVDADVIFENDEWLIQGVEELKSYKILQPFEYCAHLERDQTIFQGNKNLEQINKETKAKILAGERVENIRVWKSFCATFRDDQYKTIKHYDLHGHVGFAWGARREVLEKVPLYDKALIGGADHIIAHAAVGQISHECITKAFSENIDEILEWSKKFFEAVSVFNKVSFVRGNLLHLWHGELAKRDYLRRIQVNTSKIRQIQRKDEHGLYETDDDTFVQEYFESREVDDETDFDYYDDSTPGYETNHHSNYHHSTDNYSNQSDYTFDNYSNQNDYSSASESKDYFQSETVDFVGAGAGGSWDDSSSSTVSGEASLSAELSSFENSSTFS